jgi:hypothetical protein
MTASFPRVSRSRVFIDIDVGLAPGAIQSMTTLASTTAMTADLFQPAPALLDHQIGRGLVGSPPTAQGGFRQLCPFGEREL